MSYSRLSLTNGDVLSEAHLIHMQDGIDDVVKEANLFKEKMAKIISSKGVPTDKNDTLDQIAYNINQLGPAIVHNDEVEAELIDIRKTCETGQIQMIFTDERTRNANFTVWTRDKGTYVVDWGDGTSNTYANGGQATHTYTLGKGKPFNGTNTQFVVTIRATGGNVIERFRANADQQMQWFVSKDIYFTNIEGMFCGSNPNNGYSPINLKYVDIMGGSMASKDCSAQSAFRDCRSLERVSGVIDLSTATIASTFFHNCWKLKTIPNTLTLGSVTDVSYFFSECRVLQQVPAVLDIKNATNTSYMYTNCYELRAVPEEINIARSTNTTYMFQGCKTLTRIPEIKNATEVTSSGGMFYNCEKLTDVYPSLHMPASTNMDNLFRNCLSLVDAPSTLTMTSVTSATEMFRDCARLENAPRTIQAPVVKNMQSMFYNCTALRVAPVSISAEMATNAYHLFYNCTNLISPPTVVNFPRATHIYEMFINCRFMETCTTDIVAPAATHVYGLFNGCLSLKTIRDEYNFPEGIQCYSIFYNCQLLERAPRLVLPKGEQMYNMFMYCYNLTETQRYEFPKCRSLSQFYYGCRMLSYIRELDAPECETHHGIYREISSLVSVETLGGPKVTNIQYAFYSTSQNNLISIPNRIDLTSCTSADWNLYNSGNSPLTMDSITFVGVRSGISFYGHPSVKAIRIENQSELCQNLNFTRCGMNADAINQLFRDLKKTTAKRTITVTGNPGAATCDASIATAKGWAVTK